MFAIPTYNEQLEIIEVILQVQTNCSMTSMCSVL